MPATSVVESIASASTSIGLRSAAHLELIFRACANGSAFTCTPQFVRCKTGEAHPLGNLAIFTADPASALVQEAAAPLAGGAFPSALLFPQGVGPEVVASIGALGFGDAGVMPAMAVDLASLASTALPAGYEFVRVGPGDYDAWTDALAVGYPLPVGVARLFSPAAVGAEAAADASLQFFAVKRAGKTVATSLLFLADGLSGIYCVATLTEERGKGLGAHATAEALRAAQRVGYRVGVLQSSPDGHNVYRKLGFKDLGGVPMFVRMPG